MPANAWNMGFLPDPGRAHVPWSNEVHLKYSHWARALDQRAHCWSPLGPEPMLPKRSPCNKPAHHNQRVAPRLPQLEKSPCSYKQTQHSYKEIILKKKKNKKKPVKFNKKLTQGLISGGIPRWRVRIREDWERVETKLYFLPVCFCELGGCSIY